MGDGAVSVQARKDALSARRATVGVQDVREHRREAHRVLRLHRGAEAAQYVRSAASAVVWPRAEFADVEDWRAFLVGLFPAWAVELGVALWTSERAVILDQGAPPRRRSRPDADLVDVAYYAAAGFIGPDGLWRIEPSELLPEDVADYIPPTVHRASDVGSTRSRMARLEAAHARRT
jgi:hypothetical protein